MHVCVRACVSVRVRASLCVPVILWIEPKRQSSLDIHQGRWWRGGIRFTGEGQDELERGLTETYATHDSRDTIYDKRHDSHGCHTGETPQHATRAARGARGTQHTHDTRAAIPARRPGVPPREACERRVRRACPLPGVPGFT